MKRKSVIWTMATVLATAALLGPSPAQAYEKWVEFTIVRIVEPADGSHIPEGKTITLKAVASLDTDVSACAENPTQVSDTITLTWSATTGTFSDNSGPEAVWTAPLSSGQATITVTASDDSAPGYADDTNRSHSITLDFGSPEIVYVNDDATGANNGTSWANAYTNLNTALTNATAGSDIWVAAGTYKPAEGRGYSISLNKDLKIYGGFTGTNETALYQRDWVANQTILSGDIGTVGSDTDNSYTVVSVTHSSVVLDGFVITKGRGGNTDGAGMYISSCSPTIRNCTFTDNIADYGDGDGGGIHCYVGSPTVVNCLFLGNQAGDDGGGVCNKNASNGKYINCAFYSNSTHGDNAGRSDGGAIFNTSAEYYGTGSNPVFVNCVIAGNSTTRDGGGECTAEVTAASNATYLNCTFYANSAGDDGGAVACKDGCTVTLKNCICWADSAVGNGAEIFNSSSTVNVTYSDIQGGYAGTGNINSDPLFAKTSDLDGADNRWLTFDDGLRIRFDSPCVDAADGDAKDGCTDAGANERDALGLRHVDIRTVANAGTGTPAWYDMGAFEAAVEHTIFISVDGLAATWLDDDTLMGSATSTVMPNMKRFRDEGMWTYNARCDYFVSETTPNHITMLTGRPVSQPAGWANTTYHGWTYNGGFTDSSRTLHGYYGAGWGNPNVSYEASVYDVVHDRGGTTAEYAGKDKFIIHEWSFDLDSGRVDQVTPPDDGRDKIDTFEWTGDSSDWDSTTLVSKFIDASGQPEYDFNFTFLHLKAPDKYGHRDGWDSPSWDNGVKGVDARLGTVLGMVGSAGNKAWYGNTVVVVTADHGGTGTGHGDPTVPANYTIPFGVLGHLVPHGDAYTYSDSTRVNPGAGRPDYNSANRPIRHADGVDLLLNLMGMPSIDGASITGMGIGQ